MKPHSKLISLFAICALGTACDAEPSGSSFQLAPVEDAALRSEVQSALPLVRKACPGLDRYAQDFTPATVSDTPLRGYEGGIEISFQVVASPQTLPSPLNTYSAHHNCSIAVNDDSSKAYVGKSACHSICTGAWQENSPGLMGREFSLH